MLTNLINTVTPSGALDSIWHGLGSAMVKIKEGIYSILPEIMYGIPWWLLNHFNPIRSVLHNQNIKHI